MAKVKFFQPSNDGAMNDHRTVEDKNMPITFITKPKPKATSLIVCAGTVTCKTVDAMGSGFNVFKEQFKENKALDDKYGGWKAHLQSLIDGFRSKKTPMLPYVRIATQNGYIGGVATVPVFSKKNGGLTFTEYLNDSEREEDFKTQYRTAVEHAILDAKALNRPLFIQPLGIGVYGWSPRVAATLFAEAILKCDPERQVEITIPIFNSQRGSTDDQFKKALEACISPNATAEKNKASAEGDAPLTKKTLCQILEQLIRNIQTIGEGGRRTSGAGSKKAQLLQKLKNDIDTGEYADPLMDAVNDIMAICQMKRNPIHFWAEPHSVKEYESLLAENGIQIETQDGAHKKHNEPF